MAGLADVLIGSPDDASRVPTLRQGVVTQASPLLVRVGSATTATPARALGSSALHVGDTVSVLVVEGDRLVLGSTSGTPAPGTVLWQRAEIIQFWSVMNEIQDIGYNDQGGTLGFPTVSTFEATGIHMFPDRSTPLSALVYTNDQQEPGGAPAGTIFDYASITATLDAGWAALYGSLVAALPLPANAGQPTWTMRFSGVQGGPTNYGVRFNLRMTRVAA